MARDNHFPIPGHASARRHEEFLDAPTHRPRPGVEALVNLIRTLASDKVEPRF